jgi:tRNA(fMet)-specific endonuclease VapC
MNNVLLDTDVFSFVFKRDPRVARYVVHMSGAQLCLSFQTVAEVRYWAELRHWGARRRELLELTISRHIVLPSDDEMCSHWAAVTLQCRRAGRPIKANDAWIAATAIRHNMPLLTHNGADFTGVKNLNVVSYAS